MMRTRLLKVTPKVIGLLIVILLMSLWGKGIGVSQAQCGGSIGYGQEVYGTIYQGNECYYRFFGRAGGMATIGMTKRTNWLDPYLELHDPYGNVETYDDNSGGNGNSLISYHYLNYSGTYTIVARSLNGSGSFTLSLW
jgi:hypothetical protein